MMWQGGLLSLNCDAYSSLFLIGKKIDQSISNKSNNFHDLALTGVYFVCTRLLAGHKNIKNLIKIYRIFGNYIGCNASQKLVFKKDAPNMNVDTWQFGNYDTVNFISRKSKKKVSICIYKRESLQVYAQMKK